MSVNESDRERLATAVEFYIKRAAWGTGDEEKVEFERLLADLTARSPRNALVETLRDDGMEAAWAEYTADAFFEFAGPDAEKMVTIMLTDDGKAALVDQMLNDDVARGEAYFLTDRLAAVLKQSASRTPVLPTTPDLRTALLELLAETGSAAGWNEFIVDRWIAYTDGAPRRMMTPYVRAAFTEYVVQRGQDRESTVWLIGLLAEALAQNATNDQKDQT